jgi:hypothetical protein
MLAAEMADPNSQKNALKKRAPRKNSTTGGTDSHMDQIISRALDGDVYEVWAQHYVLHKHNKLGITDITGPFGKGPDFHGVYKGKRVQIEVERTPEQYLAHGHHKDPAFRKVSVLIVLVGCVSPARDGGFLPKTILHIDCKDFARWALPQMKKAEAVQLLNAIDESLRQEYMQKHFVLCGEKEREMAACPECDLCPYFGEGTDMDPASYLTYKASNPKKLLRLFDRLYGE